ncbi:MAG: MFS transporter [Acidimicrobiales bacterium]
MEDASPTRIGPSPVEPRTSAEEDTQIGIGVSTQGAPAPSDLEEPGRHVRIFGSHAFFRLWLGQVVSATGDWLGLIAITALAARVGAGSEGVAIGLVLAARIGPGFFLAPVAGVFADRLDRKRLMIGCDIGRAAVLAGLPFVDSIWGLVLASLVLEVFTLLWAPAKEATVPNLVPPDRLASANSLSLVAAYGTFPIGAGLFAILSRVSELFGDVRWLEVLRLNQEGLAFYADALTFLVAAFIVSTLAIPKRPRRARAESKRVELGAAFAELKEGWNFAFLNPTVRAVNLGLATGLIGGGMLVPLGAVFSNEVLGRGEAGFGLLTFGLGVGVASGVLAISLLQRRLPKSRVFQFAVIGAGGFLIAAATSSTTGPAVMFVAGLGLCAGMVYVLGFTLLHESVEDDLRGRTFGALFTLVRLCVLVAFLIGPFTAQALDSLSESLFDREVEMLGASLFLPGVRLTLWLAGAIIVGAGFLSAWSFRSAGAGSGEEWGD